MEAVAQLVRQRERVAQLACEVEHHVGMVARRHGHAVRPARFARDDRGIDPGVGEEVLHQGAGALREAVERAQDQLLGILPGQIACHLSDRRVAVPLVQVADAEQLLLDAVVANAHVIAAGDRFDKRLDRLVRGLVGEVSRRDPAGKMAQPVVDRLLLQDDVEDVAARPNVGAKRARDGMAGAAPHLAVRFAEHGQRLFKRELAAVHLDPDARTQLPEQPGPGGISNRAEIREHSLLGLGQLVRSKLASLFDRMAVAGGIGMRIQLCRLLIRELGQLEREKHAMASPLSRRLTHPREHPAGGWIPRVLAVQQVGVDLRFRSLLLGLLELAHHRRELGRLEGCHLALVGELESLCMFQRLGDRCLQGRVGRG